MSLRSRVAPKGGPRRHEGFNGRANSNCVISSSPTPGLRTVHLLRSILFRALPSHAISADSRRCLHPRSSTKSRVPSEPHRGGNPLWISPRRSAVTQFEFTCCHVADETPVIFINFFFKQVLKMFSSASSRAIFECK